MRHNKGKRYSSFSVFVFVAALGAGVFIFSNSPKKKAITADKTQASQIKEAPSPIVKIEEEKERKNKGEQTPDSKDSRDIASVAPPEEENSEWKAALGRSLEKQLAVFNVKPEIKTLGTKLSPKGAGMVSAKHVLISIDKGNGYRSSYEALVDSSTGRIIQTWNQTKFEGRKRKTILVKPLRQ